MPTRDPVSMRLLSEFVFVVFAVYVLFGTIVHWFLRMENRAAYDPLLRIYNREYCEQVLREQSRLNTRPPFSIALCDIDHFKAVNDTYGHAAGDRVLAGVAERLQKAVVPDGVAARYGGEELVVFFPQTDRKAAREKVEELRKTIERTPIRYRSRSISVTVSAGVSTRERPNQALPNVLSTADRALYRAKAQGRNRVRSGATK
jgi:diguanylate cyclase (GGDEF)-like protein